MKVIVVGSTSTCERWNTQRNSNQFSCATGFFISSHFSYIIICSSFSFQVFFCIAIIHITHKLMVYGFELISHHQAPTHKIAYINWKHCLKNSTPNSMKWQMVTRRIMWSFTAIFSGVPWTYSNLEMHWMKNANRKKNTRTNRFRYTLYRW